MRIPTRCSWEPSVSQFFNQLQVNRSLSQQHSLRESAPILLFCIASWKASLTIAQASPPVFQDVLKRLCAGITTQRDHLLYPHTGSLQSA